MSQAMSRMPAPLLLLGLAIAACGLGDARARPADLILHDAEIWTGVAGEPLWPALAIRDGEVVAVGDNF
jgi:hypothetical protein